MPLAMPLALVADPTPPPVADRPEGATAVLRTVLDHGPVGRGELSRRTGLSPAAVSRYSADLVTLGLVREAAADREPARPGRPRIPLEIDTARHLAAGVHIAGPWLTFALTDLCGRVVAHERIAKPAGADAPWVAARLPGFLRRHAGGRSVLGVGAVTGGWVDPVLGTVVENAAIGWRGVALRQELERTTWLPVHVEGHAHALAQAECLFGAARGTDLVHLFVGNVVDAAIVAGATPLRGRRNGAGGIAHLPVPGSTERCPCGAVGCLQATVSDRAVAARAVADGVIDRPDVLLLLAAARDGDARALDLCRTRLRLLAGAVSLLLDLINPQALVLTEAVTVYLPELLPELHAAVAARGTRAGEDVVRVGSFGTDTLAVAAAAPVLAAVHQDPLGLRTARSAR
ncbi:ROK family transcriptional regulator [Kitasatospora viridis]|uniref:Putative NBD/HSP70 family sugar kinase n=1 Tax=Kitasatospora viridis TaxID=281105 RepID=A0A561TWM5_9ACTN|nr:ROK family transcriptional regulator [Kitasatospora viridis]TWF91517.1 putative NBD/HSP70 family sugar kinase [Kitasatospora viridis]